MVRILQEGYTTRQIIFLGIIAAGASLTKTSGLTVLPIFLVGIALSRESRQSRLQAVAIMLILWALLAGWWYADNWLRHGDPFGTRLVAEATGARANEVDYVGELRGLYF